VTIDGVMAAIWLSEGEHTVEFRYNNTSLNIGVSISVVTLLAFLALSYFTRGRKTNSLLKT
jgi:uncharacterized membrane protein YfhO